MEQLQEELVQHENQLSQVQLAISASPDTPDKDNLIALESDIKELIKLTKDNLEQLSSAEKPQKEADPFAAEYDLFKSELAELDSDEIKDSSADAALADLNEELKSLEGMKCQAPYKYLWTNDVSYHNALVFHVDRSNEITESDQIRVKVMFTNPTHKEMLPCPFFLEGDCKFSNEKCRYSHGENVLLSSLKEYREPDFSKLSAGSKVFAKQSDGLWHRAAIVKIDGTDCEVKFESNSKEEELQLQNILPLDESCSDESDSDSDSDDSAERSGRNAVEDNEELIRRVLSAPPTSVLGEWEKFTKGFGSRIMAKMGYIHGSGLGSKGEGRVEPVSAVILPAGKSLDHCMMLRENAGGDENFFKAERKLKRLQKKREKILSRAYEREKEKKDVFAFLNSKLGQAACSGDNDRSSNENFHKRLKKETTKVLNVTSLQLSEEVRRTEKEIESLNKSLERHSSQSQAFAVIKEKLLDKQTKLSQLQASERKISNEQKQRKDRQKLSVF